MSQGRRDKIMELSSMKEIFSFNTRHKKMSTNLSLMWIALLLLFFTQMVSAFGLFNIPGPVKLQPRFNYGAVFTRAIVPGENGSPVYVEYDEQGNVVGEIGEAIGELADLQVMAAINYNAYVADYEQLQSEFSNIRLLSKDAYQQQDFVTVDGKNVQKNKQLNEATQYVAILADEQIVNQSDDFLVLREFPIDPAVPISDKIVSLLIDEQGQIQRQSANNIAFRVGFFGDESLTDNADASVLERDHNDTIYGPIAYTPVSVNPVFTGGATITDTEGKYVLNYFIPPCPGFSYEYKTDVQLELPYSRFNPRSSVIAKYYLSRPNYDFCAQYSAYNYQLIGIESTISEPVKTPADFPVDMMVVYGQASLVNYGQGKVPLAANSKYDYESKSLYRMARQSADFDGDGQADYAVLGDKIEVTSDEGEVSEGFRPSATGTVQGIWLSSSIDTSLESFISNAISAQNALWQAYEKDGDTASAESAVADLDIIPGEPDFTRLADWSDDFKDRALLSQISDEDLGETDIYIFRESTGMLIAEQKGVNSSYRGNDAGVDSESGSFKYAMKLRGASAGFFDAITTGNKFSDWQADAGLNPELHQREADHLKQGESIKIVVINRKTGYIGTQRSTLNINVGAITIYTDPIYMYPPNLKIWAERVAGDDYVLEENSGEAQVIGNEGAATNADNHIVIYSEWLDNDGFALPTELSGYGYTGRIANISGPNQLSNASGVSHFDIPPGRKTQVIQLPGVTNNHIYIQVNGEPSNRNPVFEQGSATDHEGILTYRPEYFVPFKVPVWDEDSNNLQVQAYQTAKESNDDLEKPTPFYQWLYRSEMQFSLYDLNLQEIRVTDAENSVEDILTVDNPVISSSDQLIEFIYDIATDGNASGNDLNPLEAWSYNGDKELVFDIGGQEVAVNIDGETQSFSIEDMSLLNDFTAEDFLSISLYSNNDAGNLLWEWGFEYLDYYAVIDDDILPSEVDGAIEISADEPQLDLVAHLIGFANRAAENKYLVNIKWSNDGEGNLTSTVDSDDEYAIFKNTLTLPTRAGATANISAQLNTAESNTESLSPIKFRVVAGEPKTIVASAQNPEALYVGGQGEVVIEGYAQDAFGNRVVDGTSVTVTTDGAIELLAQPESTIDGAFTFTVSGSDYAELSEVNIRVGEIEKAIELDVKPVEISFDGLPTNIEVNSKVNFTMNVMADGAPASDYTFDVWSEGGRLTQSTVITDANGQVQLSLIAPPNESEIQVKAMTVMQSPQIATLQVVVPTVDKPRLNNQFTKMIGDATAETMFNYKRWDGNEFNISKAVAGSIDVYGNSDEKLTVNIGDIFAPNRRTTAAYWMNSNAEALDEAGIANGVTENITLSNDTRRSAGKSYRFQQGSIASQIKVESASRLQLANNTSFVVDIKPNQATGEIFNLGNGLILSLLENGRLQLAATNKDGTTFTATQSKAVALEQWHQVAGAFTNNVLTLAISDELIQVPVTGELNYTAIDTNVQMLIGQNYSGLMNSMKWFDLSSQPLTTFADGSESIEVTIEANGKFTLPINSTGEMRSFPSKLPMQTIAIQAGETQQTIELISTSTFESMAAASLSAGLIKGATPLDTSYLSVDNPALFATHSPYSTEFLFPNAHAYELSFWDALEVVSMLVGLDSLEVIWDQVGNMLAGKEVDIVAFSVAILDVLSLFPPAAPLKLVTTPAKLGIKLLKIGNNKAVKYLGGVLKKVYQGAKKGDFTLTYQGIAFFIVIADMAMDEEARGGITEIAKMINSTDDFLDLLDYFSLADDEIILETTSVDTLEAQYQQYANAQFGLFPQAQASVKADIGRLVGKLFVELAPVFAKAGKEAPKALGALGRALKKSDKAYLKGLGFNLTFLKGVLPIVKTIGPKQLRNFFSSKQRIGPLTLIAIIAYLETELDNGDFLSDEYMSEYDKKHSIKELRTLYFNSLTALAAGDKKYNNFIRNSFGAQFQLMQLAILHGASKLPGQEEVSRVIGIEVPRLVSLFAKKAELENSEETLEYQNQKQFTEYTREVDILTGTYASAEIWREMKSYKSPMSVSAWSWNNGKNSDEQNDQTTKGSSAHKQYSIDRVAKKTFARMKKEERAAKGVIERSFNVNVAQIFWHFHEFKTKSSENPSESSIKAAFKKDPTGDKALINAHIQPYNKDVFVLGTIDLLLTNTKTMLVDEIRQEVQDRINVEEIIVK